MMVYDLVIIGWGKAGKSLAKKAAAAGKLVALIEQSESQHGGSCINIACLPTKALAESAHVHAKSRRALYFEKSYDEKAFEKAQLHRQHFVNKLRSKNSLLLFNEKNIDIFEAKASFVSDKEVLVTFPDGYQETISGKYILINTGSKPRPYALAPQMDDEESFIHSSDTIFNIEELPETIGIIGSGFIGLEFASIFANFGSHVSLLAQGKQLNPKLDEDVEAALVESLEAQGIKIYYETVIHSIEERSLEVRLSASDKFYNRDFRFDQLLVAIGRVPNTEGLNLGAAGVELDEHGAIKVNERLQTTVPHIFAAGDVKGGPQFTFISYDDYRILAHNLGLSEDDRDLTNRPHWATTTFVDPPLAQIGLSEKEAQARGIDYQVKALPSSSIPKSHVVDERFGINKILLDAEGKILGASLQNPGAPEMINIIGLAMNTGISGAELGSLIFTHPSFTESLNDLLG